MFPKHIKPALFFTCTYCEFKDQSFKVSHFFSIINFIIFVRVFHLLYCPQKVSMHTTRCHPKKLEVKLRSRDYDENAKGNFRTITNFVDDLLNVFYEFCFCCLDVSIVNNSAYLTGQKLKRSRTLLFNKSHNESDKTKRTKRIFSCNLCNT